MAEADWYDRYCRVRLVLFSYGDVHTSYDAKAGVRRNLLLKGRIDDRHFLAADEQTIPPAPAFHDKPVALEISSSFNPEWWEGICAKLGAPDACGLVQVRAGVEPERVEAEFAGDEPSEVEPIRITLMVSADAFEPIWRQVAEANSQQRTMIATVTLVGDSLPKEWCLLEDLDVSEDREYAVGSFEIEGGYIDRLRGRCRFPTEDGGYGTSIDILITEARYDLSARKGRATSISCEGWVFDRGTPYHGADAWVNFFEPELDTCYYSLGDFKYRPEPVFSFRLCHVFEDDWRLLVPLLTLGVDSQILLTVSVSRKKEELLTATGELEGNVRDYEFKIFRKRLTNAQRFTN